MEKGEIQQIGIPIELYTQPNCAFVADFMGSSNILRGTLSAAGSQNIDIQWATFRYACPLPSDSGKDIMVCIRPKDISLDHNDPQRENTFQAKITVKTFAGDFYKFLITPLQKPEVEILVHVYEYEKAVSMAEGETVYASFPAPFCRLIAT